MSSVILEKSNPDNILEYTGKIIKEHNSNLQKWKILELNDGDEMLFIEDQHQSTKSDEHIYHESFVHSLMCGLINPKRVLILGGAEGCMIREVLKWKSVDHVRQIDWDSSLVEYFKTDGWSWNGGSYFNPKVYVDCKEALEWLERCVDKYDAIFIDLLDPHEVNEIEFIKQLVLASKNCLKPSGAISVNVGEVNSKYTPACDIAKWMMDIFKLPDYNRNSIRVHVPSYCGDWCFLMATPVSWNHTFQFTKIPGGLEFFTREFLHNAQFWPRHYPDILQNFWRPTESEFFKDKKLVPPVDYDYSRDSGHYGC